MIVRNFINACLANTSPFKVFTKSLLCCKVYLILRRIVHILLVLVNTSCATFIVRIYFYTHCGAVYFPLAGYDNYYVNKM